MPQSCSICITSFHSLFWHGVIQEQIPSYDGILSVYVSTLWLGVLDISDSSKGVRRTKSGSYARSSRCSLNASLFKILRNQQWLQTRHKWPQPFSPCQKNLLSSIQSGVSWGCGSQLGKLPINFTDLVMLSLSILCIWMYWIYPTLNLTVRCGKSTICRSCSERATAATIDVPHLLVCLP